MRPTVLLVDDSLTVRMDLAEAFLRGGFDTVQCADLAAAREALAHRAFDAVVLDLLLPDGDGLDLLREMRGSAANAATPVMLLSSESDVRDRIHGLETGADEYVGKPYDAGLVVARTRDLVRRTHPAAGRTRRLVLVIDDSLTSREELRRALERVGHDVVTAVTGEDGLRIAADRRPDAIIVDGVLPGIDGATVVRHVRGDAALRRTPTILLTGSTGDGGELRALDAGADVYVRKDDGQAVVMARLDALLRATAAAAAPLTASLLGPKRILVVDDSPAHLEKLAEHLRMDGYDLVLARSGEEALALLDVDRVDCILLDVVMPGLSGLEACRRIRAKPALRDVPLVMISDLEDRAALIEGINAGADDYVTKSSEMDVVRARVRAQLRRKQFEEENRIIREELLRKELEAAEARAAREAYARNAAILETIADAFFAVDQEWRFVYANRALEAVVGAPRGGLVGESLWQRIPWLVGTQLEQELRRVAEHRAPVTFEERFPSGSWFEIRAFPHEAGLSASLRDVTDRRRMQDALRRSEEGLREADRHKNEFLGILSHELRNPLAPIRNALHILRRAAPGGDQAARARAVIERQVDHLTRLVDDLLDVTRISRGKIHLQRDRVDLAEVIRRTAEDHKGLFAGGEIALDVSCAQTLWVDGDITRLAQIVGNLLHNAAKFTDPGGRVVVSAEADGPVAVVRVRDTGIGIAPEVLPRVFEAFVQEESTLHRSRGGLGLGLGLVKGLVELHGGSVTARSEGLGCGAEFTIHLPLLEDVSGPLRRTEAPSPIPRRRILLVEDNLDAAETLRELLEIDGHEVEIAHDGNSGIEKARQLRPDVVLCDIGLPGKDGYEVARAIRGDVALAATLVVALTGYAMPDDQRRALEAGFDRHLTKPPNLSELDQILLEGGRS